MRDRIGWLAALAALLLVAGVVPGAERESGFHPERRVREATRLDWEFAAGPGAKLPGRYDSRRQRYQLFAPATYKPTKAWPLVVFVSPGDDPLGWRAWSKPCEAADWFFAAAYAAGNSCPPGQRVRAILDVLDDVRRQFRIDPDRTYLCGLAGGSAVACRIAFSLPESFGGIVSLSGDVPLPDLEHLRKRAGDRLSVALVCGRDDPARARQEKYLLPVLDALRIRSKVWVVPDLARGLPPAGTLTEVQRWLEEDLKRRRQDRKERLGGSADPTRKSLATLGLEQARKDLLQTERLSEGAARLGWLVSRYGGTESGEKAAELLAELRRDPRRGRGLAEQTARSQRSYLSVRAGALEALGRAEEARRAWEGVARLAEGEDRAHANEQARRLKGTLERAAYLGAVFAGDTTVLQSVSPGGPAHRAGLKAGDRLERVGAAKVSTPADVSAHVRAAWPGEKMQFSLLRSGKEASVVVTLGTRPVSDPRTR
jgi:pimeloyl-ACP methyl ester carboxylesterase